MTQVPTDIVPWCAMCIEPNVLYQARPGSTILLCQRHLRSALGLPPSLSDRLQAAWRAFWRVVGSEGGHDDK